MKNDRTKEEGRKERRKEGRKEKRKTGRIKIIKIKIQEICDLTLSNTKNE